MRFLLVSIPFKMALLDLHQCSASPINLKVANCTFWESVQSKAFNNLALFRAKFACNLAIRYFVFMWELCKGSVWESVKKSQEVCNPRESCD